MRCRQLRRVRRSLFSLPRGSIIRTMAPRRRHESARIAAAMSSREWGWGVKSPTTGSLPSNPARGRIFEAGCCCASVLHTLQMSEHQSPHHAERGCHAGVVLKFSFMSTLLETPFLLSIENESIGLLPQERRAARARVFRYEFLGSHLVVLYIMKISCQRLVVSSILKCHETCSYKGQNCMLKLAG